MLVGLAGARPDRRLRRLTTTAHPECDASGHTGQRATAFTPWWTYHRTTSRSGHTTKPPGTLAPAWTKGLGAAVYGEPLVVGRSLIAATEGNQVVSMNAAHGTQEVVGRPRDAAAA